MSSTTKQQLLRKETELRCEIPESAVLVVKLVAGSAEIFGIELAMNKEYTFRDQNIAIFSWYGCTIEVTASEGCSLYDSDSTPMVAYVNTHVQLEARRDVASANKDNGPRVTLKQFDLMFTWLTLSFPGFVGFNCWTCRAWEVHTYADIGGLRCQVGQNTDYGGP
jgi:hypothetical protein